jgi:hypothetical protein
MIWYRFSGKGGVMHTVEEIIEQVRRLSLQDRRWLVEELERLLAKEIEENQLPLGGPYARSLALAGTVHTDFTDVSVDKYKHLAEAYTDRNDNQ